MGLWDFLQTSADEQNAQRGKAGMQAGQAANQFADQGQSGFGALGLQLGDQARQLSEQAQGHNLVSAELLRQGMQQGQAAQQSMAAGANPQNAAMAARNAMQNMNRTGYGLSGQQAVAGMQEANAARQQLTNMLLQQRGQDMTTALQGRGIAVDAFGRPVQQSAATQGAMGALGGAAAAAPMAIAASDRRLKMDVVDDSKASKAKNILKHLKPAEFSYRDERFGSGKQYGVMAQDMERAGLGHAVIDTPAGKMVHGAKAATTALALSAALSRRVEKLEKGGKR